MQKITSYYSNLNIIINVTNSKIVQQNLSRKKSLLPTNKIIPHFSCHLIAKRLNSLV